MTEVSLGSLSSLQAAWQAGTRPIDVVDEVIRRVDATRDLNVWIDLVPFDELRAAATALGEWTADAGPIWGVPFAVKDNIDVAGRKTTAGCPAFGYTAMVTAPAVARLLDAGALLVGKTNMDQFATGLSGSRSPYGVGRSVLDPSLISGGSSSGSAIAVAAGLVTIALGTDTAGSGRVPAACNGIVGLKPSVGLVPTRGVVPACPSIDCVSIFTVEVADAREVLRAMAGYDERDPFSRVLPQPNGPKRGAPRIGVPDETCPVPEVFRKRADTFAASVGASLESIDLSSHLEAGELLYRGAWLAERYGSFGGFLDDHPDEVDATVAEVVHRGASITGSEVFADQTRLRTLHRRADGAWTSCDAILLPTVDYVPTVAEMAASPIDANARLGRFTTFVNLLDMAAVAVPAGVGNDGRPFGLTLIGPAGTDDWLCDLAAAARDALR